MNTQVSYFKKALVVLMAVMMVFTMMPSMAWADGETSITLDKTTLSLMVGDIQTLTATTSSADETVTWTTSDDKVATVENGKVTAVAIGTATITAVGSRGNTATCEVSILKWELSTNGTLTISGTGAMANYTVSKLPWKEQREKVQQVHIEDGVTYIGNNAFNGCINLQSVTLGKNIASIGNYAFKNCSALTEISLPESLTNIKIGVFQGCASLIIITIPTNVESVGTNALKDCTNLKTLTLKNVVTEDNLPTITNGYIDGCIALQDVKIENVNSTVKAEGGVFYSKDGATLIRCLPSKKGKVTVSNTVKTIKEDAFSGCGALEELILPKPIETAYNNILFNCSSLWYVELKGVKKVVNWAFEGCTALDQLVLPACLTSYAETSVTPKLICFRGTEEEWEAATTETVRTKLADKGTVVVYNYDDKTGAEATITVQPDASVNIGLGQTKYLSVTVGEEKGTQYYYRWFKKEGTETKKVSNLSEDARYKVDSSEKGTANYYCEVVTVKDGKTAVTKSDEAAVTVGDLQAEFSGGSGTQADPYKLATPENMSELAGLVNSGISFEKNYFKLTADITLPDNWKPIGCKINSNTGIEAGKNLYAFSGTIDGAKADGAGNYTLTVPKDGLPLLGYVKGATVKNLNLAGERINGYGLVNNFEGVGLSGSAITIDNVTIKSGTNIVKSGLLGATINENPYAGVSAVFYATIKNCTIEQGAVIGCDEDQNMIGGFAGRMQGTIENCKNYGTVKGKNVVGGIIGTRDNALNASTAAAKCTVKNCQFNGSVTGDSNVGGIVGSGYMTENSLTASAPNGQRINILGNTVGESAVVSGNENVGGILGSDLYVAQVWDNVIYTFAGNSFSGKISGKTNVGGIIGFYDSLNKYDNIAGNFYKTGCGATKGIGAVKYVDTNAKKPTKVSGTTYINTEFSVLECPAVEGCKWQVGHNRTDDPLGTDASRLAEAVETIPTDPICYELTVEGSVAEHYAGDELNLTGLTFTAKWTDGKATNPTFGTGDENVKATGYNKNSHSIQTVTLTYGNAQTTIQVAVKQKESSSDTTKNTLTVNFTLLGDNEHTDATANGGPHGLAMGGLTTWISKTSYEVPLNSTVWDLMQTVAKKNSDVTFNAKGTQYGTYIYSVTYDGTELGEFDNGKNSGWMYTVNGTHPEVGVGSRFLNNGDVVVFHYTDDYTKEEGSEKWNSGTKTEETKTVTTDTASGAAATTAPTETKVTEKVNADGTKEKTVAVTVSADNQTEIIKQATDKKSTEIVLEVASTATNGAQNVQLQLNVSFVKNVSEKTDAALTVNTENGTVSLDQDTIKTVLDEAKGATITLNVNKVANPTETQKKAAGESGQILSLTVKSGDKTISDFKTGKVTVTVAIEAALQNKRVAAIHIAEDGKIEQMPGKSREVNGKKCFEFTTSHFSDFALVDADELGLETEEEIDAAAAAALVAKLTPVARSAKTAKGYIKVTTNLDKQDKAIISDLADAGYTVKYRFFRSTKKAANYKSAITKKTTSYTNTTGKKGTKYFYKVQVRVYDASGKLVARTALRQCKYAVRTR